MCFEKEVVEIRVIESRMSEKDRRFVFVYVFEDMDVVAAAWWFGSGIRRERRRIWRGRWSVCQYGLFLVSGLSLLFRKQVTYGVVSTRHL